MQSSSNIAPEKDVYLTLTDIKRQGFGTLMSLLRYHCHLIMWEVKLVLEGVSAS